LPAACAATYGRRVNGSAPLSPATSPGTPPATPRTSLPYRVPYADTDQMGVVYYANYFVWFERVRNEVLRDRGVTYKEMEAAGILLPVIEAHCDFKQPAAYDDALEIVGWFELPSPTRIRANCEIRRAGALLASGHTVHVVLSAQTRKPMRLAEELAQRIFQRA
jgi:acyl-CoA thioester hydrolase